MSTQPKTQYDAINNLFIFLWFIKDCSCHIRTIFVQLTSKVGGYVFPNRKLYTSADGIDKKTFFTHEEIDRAIAILLKYFELVGQNAKYRESDFEINEAGEISPSYHQRSYSETTKLERALSFLSIARANDFIIIRISLYIPVLESLFSIDRKNVSENVSDRSAKFIGANKKERNKIYRDIKYAYDIRSAFLYGSPLERHQDKIEDLMALSIRIDDYVRRVLTKVIMVDSSIVTIKDRKKLEEYFKNLLSQLY